MAIRRFEQKVWLSSPTMHGPELDYIKEAYETNWMSTVGKNIEEAERLACEKTGCGHGVPVFIDTEYDTWNMDPEALEQAFKIYPEVKVVVFVHLYGTPGKIETIRDICDRHGAILIEDAAESLGATYKGRQTGTFGTYNAISFNGNNVFETES